MSKKRSTWIQLTPRFVRLFGVVGVLSIVLLYASKAQANVAPTVNALIPSDVAGVGDITGTGFTPNESVTKELFVRGTLLDEDGCSDLDTVTITLYRSSNPGVESCTLDNNDCYRTSTNVFTGCDGGPDTSADFEVSVPIANFVDPTDAGAYAADAWTVHADVQDFSVEHGVLDAAFEMNSLAALDVAPTSIVYGSLTLGIDSAQQSIVFSNTGNRDINTLVRSETALVSDLVGFADIPSDNVKMSLSDGFEYGTGIPIGLVDSTLAINLLQQTDDGGAVPSVVAYFILRVPLHGVKGTYTNILDFTATAL